MGFVGKLKRLLFGPKGTPSTTKPDAPAPEEIPPSPPGAKVIIPPSAEDQQHLERYEAKLQLVRDYTRGVALGYSAGFYLHGAGGISKSFTVLGELERLKANFKLFNSRMSGRGLFDTLQQFPDAVHVLEDMERVVNDKDAQGVLRSATWSQKGNDGKQKRVVTWATARGVDQFVFNGGIIMLSNRPLDDLPELRAIQTRISYLELVVSENEVAALMRKVAGGGFHHGQQAMTAQECLEVCEFLIGESKSLLCHLDMRLLDNSFRDYLQHREGCSSSHWKTLVAARLHGRQGELLEAAPGRQQELEEDFAVMEAALREQPTVQQAQEVWCRATGKSRATFFRAKRAFEARNKGDS
jgi:hypothetical protein